MDMLQQINALTPVHIKPITLTKEQLKIIYNALPNGKNIIDNREIRFVHSTLGKILRHKGFHTALIIPYLKDIFDNAIFLYSEVEREQAGNHKKHPNIKGYHNYLGKIQIDNEEYFVRFTIQEEKTKKPHHTPNMLHSTYVSSIQTINAASNLSDPRLLTGVKLAANGTNLDLRLIHFLQKVKDPEASKELV